MSNAFSGYVAIDEVKLLIASCPASQYCDFETEDICNYQNDVTADFEWKRNSGKTSSANTGPDFDHTYQTTAGHYMYLKASDQQEGNCL